jgi:hypothetical protein
VGAKGDVTCTGVVTFENSSQSHLRGVLADAGGKPALAKTRHSADAARPAAILECNIEADKYSPITQLPNQFAVYGT